MKSQQTLKVKSLKARSSPKRFFANYRHSPAHKQISPSKQSKYNDFIEGYPSPNSSLRQLSDVLTQKQLAKISLFESVRKAKGQFYFKTIYQKSKYTELASPIKTQIQQFLVQRKYFVYLLSGQVHLYKLTQQGMKNYGKSQKQVKDLKQGVQSVMNKCYIRSYGAHEHFGYQQYPLYWGQKLFIQPTPDTKVIMFPLDTFYKVFSNVISLAAIQITAEFFKKISVFKETQMEKLLRISTFCQRIRTYPNTTIVEKGQKIQNIILLYDGRISLSNKEGFYTEQTNGILMGKHQIDEKKTNFQHQIRALIQCDLIVIPLAQFSKVSQIRHKLRDSILDDGQKNIKSRKKMHSNLSQHENDKKYSVTGYQTLEEQIFKQNISSDSFKGTKSNTFMIVDQNETKTNSPKTMVKHRPKTASVVLSMNRGVSRSIIYDDNGRQFFVNRSKTSSSEKHSISNAFKSCQSQTKISSAKQLKQSPQNLTMGEIYWAKFMNRKQQLQNKQITKIINARLPESILNTGKQYSVMKPFVQKKSSYIKNYKRKLRQSHRINEVDKIANDEESMNLMNLKVEPQNQPTKFCLKSFIIVDDEI